ncbi:UDP-N-acetylglucosamine--dolichyl-phosphate N-acetylglucosaminephosphotransferase [Polychytrium aggregatum]|uniref:UDP-N-acetylglucosamine--dolichyl-phosphate N-acetylglucosaminephosphotransferase n=1 Tax=Polychytrium aggregatum TaxID=110093 RepID=UPI0022FE7CF8|nr:UDP-N-acetylglucosamine--dolichyl-phosphate N-acetylglucosaminephosphotransferase [Polychytrium aggregatum]KAI9202355.1 UDP-N-acetylglucosamine--dolichyl-phosphate N-acetylglucosaminephosphotransferase [Polychytrium aggregatum]
MLKSLAPSGVLLVAILTAIHDPLTVYILVGLIASMLTYHAINWVREVFIKHGRFGKDLLKPNTPVIPESMGVVVGAVYFISMFLTLPIPFMPWFVKEDSDLDLQAQAEFPHQRFAHVLGGLLSLFSMLFLGFADDVLDIRWRVKIWFPFVATLPLLMVYYVSGGLSTIMIPKILWSVMDTRTIDLGVLYYVFMACLATFSTNAINILAGVNGIEGGQALVISSSLAINNIIWYSFSTKDPTRQAHLSSLHFLLPFIGVTVGYLRHNWYPAKAFGGDSFCYFAGMTIAVVGIINHMSKTVIIFMIPQIFNFIYSCPQLFHLVECPRHRMPKLNPKTGKLEASQLSLKGIKPLGRVCVLILNALGLCKIQRDPKTNEWVSCNNFTLINLVLVKLGPMTEEQTCRWVLWIQILSSCLGFLIRFGGAHLFYGIGN